ncbi:MAG: hypothetical protein COA79_10970 [Planctomycetota bacterium]|nr:MAG: hypothetical protein COA79_10970 [Planctomycetota bacterium]
MDPIQIVYFTIICVGLIIFSGLFSMIEIAIFTCPMAKIQAEIDNNNKSAVDLMNLKNLIHDTIASIVIMNNIINIGGMFFIGILTQQWLSPHYPILGNYIMPSLMVILVIIFGEVVPKSIGETYNIAISLRVSKFIKVLNKILSVPIKILSFFTRFISKDTPVTSEDEIKDLVNLGGKSGAIEDYEKEIIENIFNLNDVTAKSIMSHRVHMSALDETTKILDISADDLENLHSRIVIYDDDLDHITGIVLQKDILLAHAKDREIIMLSEIAHPSHTVYEDVTAQHLLELFKKTRQHLFVVIDKEGGTCGVVTLEDVLEEIVGEIQDETDDENEDSKKEEVVEERIAELNVLETPSSDDKNTKENDADNDTNGLKTSDSAI